MGVRLLYLVLLLLYCVCVVHIKSVYALGICEIRGCNCTKRAGDWKYVNCTFGNTQAVIIHPDLIHEKIVEIYFNGGQSIAFQANSLTSLHVGLSIIRIDGATQVEFISKAFVNINSSSLLVQLENCDYVTIQTGAFENIQGSLEVEITQVNQILRINKWAFSKLTTSKFKNIKELILFEGAFEFRNQGSMTRHGLVTSIHFDNVMVPSIPKEAFFSAIAAIKFENSEIHTIYGEAFKASEISAISFINTTLHNLKNGALSQRTLVLNLIISKCKIKNFEPKSIMAAISNLTVSYSVITDLNTDAISCTAAKTEIIGNVITNFYSHGIILNEWTKIVMEDNVIKNLYSNFIQAPVSKGMENFIFKGNEIHSLETNALSFVAELENSVLTIDDNFFNHSCNCEIEEWLTSVTNHSKTIDHITETSFCTVNELFSRCLELKVEIINIKNFTEIACQKKVVCEPYHGESRTVNSTSKILFEDDSDKKKFFMIIMAVIGALMVSIIITFIVLLVRGSRWLKRKGYFRNIQYNHNETSNDDENTIVTVDENEKLEIPEELTIEFLQVLSQKLDDPTTHQEASEMIERLYEMFIVDDSYGENRQEEAHLYEELGNLNLQIPPPPYEREEKPQPSNEAKSILKLMGEKFNLQINDEEEEEVVPANNKPKLTGDYSEPQDAAVHLYSELKRKSDNNENSSDALASRPLPNKPNSVLFFEAGPSNSHL